MSRSALWHQEKNQQMRLLKAEEVFRNAILEGKEKERSLSNKRSANAGRLIPLWKSSSNNTSDNFNLNPMLLNNIIQSQYFVKLCDTICDWNALVDEIYYHVKHLEPWSHGGGGGGAGGGSVSLDASKKIPSTAFCLLLRLFTLRCSEKQMVSMLEHVDSPYIRGIGFLYLRYGCDPASVWQYIQPYLFDPEPIQVGVAGGMSSKSKHNNIIETVGDYVRFLFTTNEYYGTRLPRLPIELERQIAVKILVADKIQQRANRHFKNKRLMQGRFSTVGSKIIALYGDEENPTQWYHAVIDRVIHSAGQGAHDGQAHPKFIVTFPDYGNTEEVTLGEIDVPPLDGVLPPYNAGVINKSYTNSEGRGEKGRDRDRGYGNNRSDDQDRGSSYQRHNASSGYDRYDIRSRRPSHQGYDYNYDRDERYDYDDHYKNDKRKHNQDDLYEEVRRRERDNVTARGRSEYAVRPPSTKASLASASHRSKHGSYDDHQASSSYRRHSPKSHPNTGSSNTNDDGETRGDNKNHHNDAQPKKRTAEEIARIQEKKRKLMAKYG